MTCMKQEFCIHEKYCQRHIGQNFDSCILFSRNSKPMTNEEWFDKLSTEEKAMVIICCCPYESDWFGENFEKRMEQRMKNLSQSAQGYELGVQKIKEWLKQPHTKE